jgi:hypothetical protein
MQMRFKLARTVVVAGFQAESAPSGASAAHVSLDDWVADQAGNQPTRGHVLRLRMLDVSGVEQFGGSVTFRVWAKTCNGFYVSDPQVSDGTGDQRYSSFLTGDLFIQVLSLSTIGASTVTTVEFLVDESVGYSVEWVS